MINITSNIDDVIRKIPETFHHNIPFALSKAMNDSMFDARRMITGVTYQKAFHVRNSAFPRILWKIGKFARKNDLSVILQQQLDRDYFLNHVSGGAKKSHTGGRIAIPVNIARTGGGRIPAAMKPARILGKKGAYIKRGSGGREFIIRNGKMVYVLTRSANIKPTFRFFEDGISVLSRVFPGHFDTQLRKALATSHFQ